MFNTFKIFHLTFSILLLLTKIVSFAWLWFRLKPTRILDDLHERTKFRSAFIIYYHLSIVVSISVGLSRIIGRNVVGRFLEVVIGDKRLKVAFTPQWRCRTGIVFVHFSPRPIHNRKMPECGLNELVFRAIVGYCVLSIQLANTILQCLWVAHVFTEHNNALYYTFYKL